MATLMQTCPTCSTPLTLVLDFKDRRTYWICQRCNPKER